MPWARRTPSWRFWARRGWPSAVWTRMSTSRWWTRQNRIIAVCNGEIDNHRELRRWLAERGRPVHRETDVAVIPGLYLELGEAFVSKLVGAFAIAVWDARNRRLTLARDRAGERPLFYADAQRRGHFCHRDCRAGGSQPVAGEPRSEGAAQISSVRNFPLAGHAVRRNPEGRVPAN